MSLLSVNLPRLIHWRRHAKNGLYPDDAFYSDVVAGVNHITAFRRKPIYRRVCRLGESGGISGTPWRWHCRTGYGANRLVVLMVLGFDDRAIAAEPYVEVAVTKAGGATTTLAFHGGATNTPSVDSPEEWLPSIQYIDVDGASTYTGAVTFYNNARVIALQVFEDCVPTVDDATPYHQEWTPSMNSPIYDNRIGRSLEGIGELIRYNRGLRFDWSTVDGTARTRLSATPINLIDNSSAAPPTASSPGVTLNTTARNTISKTTVPILFAAYGSMVSGTGVVTLRDTAGTIHATANVNSSTPGWFTGVGSLPVGSAVKLDVFYAGDGSATLTVNAVSFYELDLAPLALMIVGHGLPDGSGPFTLTTTGTLPAGLATGTDYYSINVDDDHIHLASSRANALISAEIVLTDAGTGTHTLVTGSATQVEPLVFEEDFTTSFADGFLFFATPHGLIDGDGPYLMSTTGTLPDGYVAGTEYYANNTDTGGDPLTIMVAPTQADAIAGTNLVYPNDDGTGTHTLTALAAVTLGNSTFTVETP